MIDDTDTDFCGRLPGQHTGRLSLELQAREAAEWQRKVDDLQKQLDSANRIIQIKNETIILHEKRCDDLREELDERADTIAVLHKTILEKNEAIRNARSTSPAAGESPGISPEPEQAPVEFYREAQDTITEWANDTFGPSDSNIRIAARANEEMAELLRALSADDDNPKAAEEIADVVIVLYRVASRLGYDLHRMIDKKMDINRGREWKLDNTGHGYHVRNKSVTPTETPTATPSAAVGAGSPDTGSTVPPEVGKRYICRNGEITEPMERRCGGTYPFTAKVGPKSVQRTWAEEGRHDVYLKGPRPYDLVAEYHESEPSPPAEPSSITVPLTEREKQVLGELSARQELPEDRVMIQALRLYQASMCSIPDIPKASCDQPAESPDDWVTQDRVTARVALDEYRVSGSQSEPGVWKRCIYGTFPIVHGYQHGRPLITGTGNSTLELRCRRKDLPVVPHHIACSADRSKPIGSSGCSCPNAPADKPRMRHVASERKTWHVVVDTSNQDEFGNGPTGVAISEDHDDVVDAIAWMGDGVPLEVAELIASAPHLQFRVSQLTVALQQFVAWHNMDHEKMKGLEVQAAYEKVIADAKAALQDDADKPSMRQVTLREYRDRDGGTQWTTLDERFVASLTGRTAVVEVPQ